MSHKDTVFADDIVMANMDKVIDFGSLADDRTVNGSTVNTSIAADFDIIANDDVPRLKDLGMLSFARDIAKAITADDTASLEDDPVTDDTVFTNRDIRIKSTVTAHFCMAANINVRVDDGIITNLDILCNLGKRQDGGIFSNTGRRMDEGILADT